MSRSPYQFALKPLPCPDVAHVHIEQWNVAERRQINDVQIVGHDFDGRNWYGDRLKTTWHNIEPFPRDLSEYIDLDPVIAERLRRYVG